MSILQVDLLVRSTDITDRTHAKMFLKQSLVFSMWLGWMTVVRKLEICIDQYDNPCLLAAKKLKHRDVTCGY